MKKYVSIVIVIVMTFLALIIAYSMTPPDAPDAGGISAPAAKTH